MSTYRCPRNALYLTAMIPMYLWRSRRKSTSRLFSRLASIAMRLARQGTPEDATRAHGVIGCEFDELCSDLSEPGELGCEFGEPCFGLRTAISTTAMYVACFSKYFWKPAMSCVYSSARAFLNSTAWRKSSLYRSISLSRRCTLF